jgi:magnesium chelatase family protein
VEEAIFSAALYGGKAHLVRVETLVSRGLPRVQIIGMPDAVAKEARERLPAALASHDFPFPRGKVLFNLVPAQLPKGGLPIDLALAIGLLRAQGLIPSFEAPHLFLAELDLQGRLRSPARGTLLAALEASRYLKPRVITTPEAAVEAALAPGIRAYGLTDLSEVVEFLRGEVQLASCLATGPENDELHPARANPTFRMRLEDVRGQTHARKAAILAVAGRHPLLLQGPPGTGKSLLAHRLAHLLPTLSIEHALELAQMEALFGPVCKLPQRPPFRAPHPSVSAQGMFGGGRPLRPGELSRAHGGLLFLDELPEFQRPVLEGLRQPLEEREVRIQRVQEWARFPADVLLVAARNPCPCGYCTHPNIPCTCTPALLSRYRLRTSGPLLDRFDLFAEMGPVSARQMQAPPTSPTQKEALQQLDQAFDLQDKRREQSLFGPASYADMAQLQACGVHPEAQQSLHLAGESLSLSGRATLRCLRVARTVADLEGSATIQRSHLMQALSFRPSPEADPATIG